MSQELAQFDALKASITQFVAPTLTIRVTDVESSQAAIDTAKEIKALAGAAEKKRKELVEPLNRQVKMINEYVKNLLLPLDEAEQHVKGELNRHAAELEKIRQEAIRKAELEHQEAERKLAEQRAKEEAALRARQEEEAARRNAALEMFGTDEAVEENPVAEAERKAEHERLELEAKYERERISNLVDMKGKTWDANQDQIKGVRKNWKCEATDLAKVPREFLVITLNEKAILAAARGGVTEIPGVRLWQETAVSIGSKTYMPKAVN